MSSIPSKVAEHLDEITGRLVDGAQTLAGKAQSVIEAGLHGTADIAEHALAATEQAGSAVTSATSKMLQSLGVSTRDVNQHLTDASLAIGTGAENLATSIRPFTSKIQTRVIWLALALSVPAWWLFQRLRAARLLSVDSVRVKDIFIFPIKACRGVRVDKAEVTPTGFYMDRWWMVLDRSGKFVSQRQCPKMALIQTEIDDDNSVYVTAPGMHRLRVGMPGEASGGLMTAYIWDSPPCKTRVVSERCNEWFSSFLDRPVFLVQKLPEHQHDRPLPPNYNPLPAESGMSVAFADGFPFLVASDASIHDLNRRLDKPVSMLNFRPNIVVSGSKPFEEDLWHRMRVDGTTIELVKPCTRCSVPAVDIATGTRCREPTQTLRRYRAIGSKTFFGQNGIPTSSGGTISVGSRVEVEGPRLDDVSFLTLKLNYGRC